MNDDGLDGEDRVYSDPELVEGFLQNILWPILESGPNSLVFLINRSDLTDLFGPGMTEEDYRQVRLTNATASKCKSGITAGFIKSWNTSAMTSR